MARGNEMQQISYVKATASDAQSFIALQEESTDRKLWGPIDGPERAMREIAENTLLLLRTGDETVGSIAYRVRSDQSVYISNVIVVPPARGRGFARSALSHVLEMNRHAPRIDLVTHPENERALRLYQSLGFAIESYKDNYFGDGEPRLVLARTAD
jgi:ribosomal protein S18 acetylase RimI-like enzyme